MRNISTYFSDLHVPQRALMIYTKPDSTNDMLVEAFDVDDRGFMINAHPLSFDETVNMAISMNTSKHLRNDFLISRGLLPEKVLYINWTGTGQVIWYTPTQKANLLFKKDLTIPGGEATVPALIWIATPHKLAMFAVKTNRKPDIKTTLYHAPFFNINEDGDVCMGTVNTTFEENCYLENFMQRWENYFWKSYFSHMIEGASPVKMNIIQLWQDLVNTGKPFPMDVLKKHTQTLKHLL